MKKETKLALLNKIILITITVVIALFSLISFLSITALAQTKAAIPLSLITSSQPQQTTEPSWKTYENPVYGFRIQYPIDWNVTTSHLQIYDTIEEESERVIAEFESPERANFSISAQLKIPQYLDTNTLTVQNKTAHDYILEYLAASQSNSPYFANKYIKDYETTVSGYPAWSLEEISRFILFKTQYIKTTYVIKDAKMYNLVYNIDPLLVPKIRPIAEKMIDSFEFIK